MEDKAVALNIAKTVKQICEELDIHYIFKASYKKANRSRLDSFTGIGNQKALEFIKEIGEELNLETITDIHESYEAEIVKDYVSHIQIPAFLCRQTDLLIAAGKTACGVNIKKGQFLSPEAMKFAIEKVKSTGNNNVWVCERGTTFGYNNLIVDATSISRMKKLNVPVVMDCTHSVQKPNTTEGITGGDKNLIEAITLSAIATGADGLFLEVHPEPQTALSDPHTMLRLDKLKEILEKAVRIRKVL